MTKNFIYLFFILSLLQGSISQADTSNLNITCYSGFYLSDGTCYACSSDCDSCSSFYNCDSCYSGYSLSEGYCSFDSYCSSDCEVCTSDLECILCDSGYSLSNGDCSYDSPINTGTIIIIAAVIFVLSWITYVIKKSKQ